MNLKIKNLDLILPNHNGYGVILSEHHPDVKFTKQRWARPILSYLWYPIELGKIPNTFTDYFREKLGITDLQESIKSVKNWNAIVARKTLPQKTLFAHFNIGMKQFGLLKDDPNDGSITVLTNYFNLPKHRLIIKARIGGYVWQYLPNSILSDSQSDRDVLAYRLGLYLKGNQTQFIKKWNKVV